MSPSTDPSHLDAAATVAPRRHSRTRRLVKWTLSAVGVVLVGLAFVVSANPFNIRNEFLADRIVELRVAPERLESQDSAAMVAESEAKKTPDKPGFFNSLKSSAYSSPLSSSTASSRRGRSTSSM